MESADLDNFLNLGRIFFNEFKNSYLINNHKITREKKRTKFNANAKKIFNRNSQRDYSIFLCVYFV